MAAVIEASKIESALDAGRRRFVDSVGHDPTGPEIVWELFKEATDTSARLPDRERGWIYATASTWPDYMPDKEVLADQWAAILASLQRGERPIEVREGHKGVPDAAAIDRVWVVLDFRQYLKGRKRERDWRILWGLAAVQERTLRGGVKQLAKRCHCSPSTCYQVRDLQLGQIYNGLNTKSGGK